LEDAPSKVNEKLESFAVDWSEGFHGDCCEVVNIDVEADL